MGMLISLADSITILSFSLSSPSMNIIDIDLFASFSKTGNVTSLCLGSQTQCNMQSMHLPWIGQSLQCPLFFPHSVCWAESFRNLPKSATGTQL